MKRAMICIVMLMAMVFCASAQDTVQVSVRKEPIGQIYLPLNVGYSLSPGSGVIAGLGVGYKLNCGVSFEGSVSFRQLTQSNCLVPCVDVSYEFPMCKRVYPVLGIGVGGVVILPQQVAFFTLDYHVGCNFVVVENFIDLGFKYQGDAIGPAWVQHSVMLDLRFYIVNLKQKNRVH